MDLRTVPDTGGRCVDTLRSTISPARKPYLLPGAIPLDNSLGQFPWNRGPDGNASRAWAGYLRRHHRGARRPAPPACAGHPRRHRRSDSGRHAWCRFLRRRRAPSRRLRRLRAGRGAGGDRGAHQPHASRLGGDRAELGRSGSRGPAVCDARRRIERARGGHPRPRLVHRILSLVRIRAQPVRGAVRRQARSVRGADPAGARDLAGQDAPRARRPACVPADRAGIAEDLDRRRRQPGIRGARRALRPAR